MQERPSEALILAFKAALASFHQENIVLRPRVEKEALLILS